MPIATTTAIIAGAALAGAGASIYAADQASDAQRDAAVNAQRADEKKFQQIRSDLAPYRDAGGSALTKYADSLGLNGDAARDQFRTDFRADPGYQYAFDEGMRAVEGSAAARGGVLNGGTLRALQRTGQGMADQQYGSYLDRFMGLANMGQNSAAQTGQFANASAGRQGQYALDAGAARAGGYLSAANGVNGAISNGLQLYGYGQGQGWFNGNGGSTDWSGVSGPQTIYRS